MVSQDVAGILAAAQGESVTFPGGHFKYEFHNLDFMRTMAKYVRN